MINTRCSWLPGDERGFRSRDHRIHSSGDYKNPPPEDEHEGLREYNEEQSGDPIVIPPDLRPVIGKAIVKNLLGRGHRTLAIAISEIHGHLLVELPDRVDEIKIIIGWAKQKSSAAVTDRMPGSVWGEGEGYKPVDSRAHLLKAFDYILTDQGPGAWTWSFREPVPE